MDRKIATIVGAAAALVAVPAAAHAAIHEAPAVSAAASYAELLEPIANPVEQLKIANARDAHSGFQDVQFSVGVDLGHHHHHHHDRRWYLRNGYMWFGGRWVTRDYWNHHHHHHHSHDR